jgi:glycerol-3-phosphate dehydrogenase
MVKYSYAGIYPLIDDEINTKVYQGTGEYQVVDHVTSDNTDGLVTVFGAKFTTARLLAEKSLNKIQHKFVKSIKRCQTRSLSLPCGDIDNMTQFRKNKRNQYAHVLDGNVIDHLVTYYGTDVDQVLDYVVKDASWGQSLSAAYPDIEAQIIYAVEREMACHLDDILFRRTGIGTLGNPGIEVISRCANIMARNLHWDKEYHQEEIDRVLAYYHYDA